MFSYISLIFSGFCITSFTCLGLWYAACLALHINAHLKHIIYLGILNKYIIYLGISTIVFFIIMPMYNLFYINLEDLLEDPLWQVDAFTKMEIFWNRDSPTPAIQHKSVFSLLLETQKSVEATNLDDNMVLLRFYIGGRYKTYVCSIILNQSHISKILETTPGIYIQLDGIKVYQDYYDRYGTKHENRTDIAETVYFGIVQRKPTWFNPRKTCLVIKGDLYKKSSVEYWIRDFIKDL